MAATNVTQCWEIKGRFFYKVPLRDVSRKPAQSLIRQIYGPQERFAQLFHRYRSDVLKYPEEQAWAETQAELDNNIQRLMGSLDDPTLQTMGYFANKRYVPVGLYGLCNMSDHPRGLKVLELLEEQGLSETYSGSGMLIHSFSFLNRFRNIEMLKFAFISIALEAVGKNAEYVFFFISDYRLKSIYERYGLEFLENASLENDRYWVGYYRLSPENLRRIEQAVQDKQQEWSQMHYPAAAAYG